MSLLSPRVNPFQLSSPLQVLPARAGSSLSASPPVAHLRFQAEKPHQLQLPVVNYQDLLKGDPKAIELLCNTLRDVGFVALSDHGIPANKLQRLRDATQHLLSQDEAVLAKYHHPEIGGEYGYRARKDALIPQIVDTKHPVDSKRIWQLGERIPVFPVEAEAPGFRREMSDAYDQLKGIGLTVANRLASYLKVPPETVNQLFGTHNGTPTDSHVLRALLYDGFPAEALKDFPKDTLLLRARPHTDLSFLTLQVEASQSGLQLKRHGHDEWETVTVPPDLVVVNTGQLLDLMTANIPDRHIKAAPHRVVATLEQAQTQRVALPFFLHVHPDTPLINWHTGEVLFDEARRRFFDWRQAKGTIPAELTYPHYKAELKAKEQQFKTREGLSLSA